LSIEKHQQTKNILQNKGLVIRGVLSTDTAEKTCSCHQQFIWVIFSNKHEAPNNRLKKKRWKLPRIPQNTSLQVVRINVKQITVE